MCPKCGYEHVTPAEGLSAAQAKRRLLLPIALMGVVFLWALLYLTLPVASTIINGSINWMMTIIVAAMWPLAAFAAVVVWRVALERAMLPAYVCDRCGVRWPR